MAANPAASTVITMVLTVAFRMARPFARRELREIAQAEAKVYSTTTYPAGGS
jgi:hypothetical protein